MASQDIDETTQDPRTTAKLNELLARAPVLFDRIVALSRAGPAPTSAAAEDGSSPLGHHVRVLATDCLSSGLEHLVIWHRLLTAGVQPYATHMTLIRGAMEGAVTCRWLIDPRTVSAERVRRGVALLLDDYRSRRDFERDLNLPLDAIRPPAKSGAQRYAELRDERDALRIGRVDVPTMTARFSGYAVPDGRQGRALYRLLSAYAHGRQWKALTMTLRALDAGHETRGVRLTRVTAGDTVSVMTTAVAIQTAELAVAELAGYYEGP